MSRREREKGARGQRAVRQLFEAHGWTMVAGMTGHRRGEAGTPDFIAHRGGVTLAVEVKNQAVLRLPLWRRQTLANAPEGTVPVLVYRAPKAWLAEWYARGSWGGVEAQAFAAFFTASGGGIPVAA